MTTEPKRKMALGCRLGLTAIALVLLTCRAAEARVITANPRNVKTLLATLKPGDTLVLASDIYGPLRLSQLHGRPNAWITVMGSRSPEGTAATIITGNPCCNTIEIVNSSYLAIAKLRIDGGDGNDSRFGISATGVKNVVHDILIQDNVLVGQHASQQNDGISTKVPTWNWIIRGNKIFGAGTGIYLGNSDGTDPFVAGLIENNLVQDTIGYNMEIKFQNPRPSVAGMPTGFSTTIIRNNTFIKGDEPSPDGDRSNVLVGGFPASGPGSGDLYQIYGNFFYHNPREALLQISGRAAVHDNLFVGGTPAAIVLRDHDLPLKLVYIYNNTIYSSEKGIFFLNPAQTSSIVRGNLVLAATPISGTITDQSGNLTDSLQKAGDYVNSPSFVLGLMNFYPLAGKVEGDPIDLSPFASEVDYNLDFNRTRKNLASEKNVFRGAYAGEGTNPGWKVQAGTKPAPPQSGFPSFGFPLER